MLNTFHWLQSLQWEPVEFFNNKIICDLVEEKHKGIIAILVSRSCDVCGSCDMCGSCDVCGSYDTCVDHVIHGIIG